tara:strand:+ start:897 stop:1451 length:555 start_codon:yes stop_codon:yes gene_type:complete
MSFKFNPLTGTLDIAGSSGGSLTGVVDSNSIDFSVSGGVNVTGNVNLSVVPADSNYTLVDLDIQTDGIRAEIANSDIKSAALDLVGPNTLLDNTTSTAISYAHATNKFTFIDYSIVRNGTLRCGRLLVVNDSSSATIADNGYVEQGAVGVSFGVLISGANVVIQYTTTNTGFNGTFKYSLNQWS